MTSTTGLSGSPNELFSDPSAAVTGAQTGQIDAGVQPQAGPVQPTGQTQLPPTGIEQQLSTMQAQPQDQPQPQAGAGSTSLESLVQRMSSQMGLSLPRGNIVDESGNILITPDQLQEASGGTESLGSAAWKLGSLSDAVTRRLNEKQQDKARAAVATGIGQVQQRGRGSLASLQMGAYRDMADLYANQEYEAADFSFWIQREQQMLAQGMEQQALDASQKSSTMSSVLGGATMGATIGGPVGALIGGGAGLLMDKWDDWF